MNQQMARLVKEALFRSPLRRFAFPTYVYEFTPPQLCFLCRCVERARGVDGAVFEVGCSSGATTVFLKKYMDCAGIEKDYYAVDTFAGFPSADVGFEVAQRHKTPEMYRGRFVANKKKWFDATMRRHHLEVRSVQGDVNQLDLRQQGPIAFALLDVDLYRPIAKALRELYEALSPGGIIVVDDCDPTNPRWDGADQAYREFMAFLGLSPQVVWRKLGVVVKGAGTAPTELTLA